MPDDTTILSLPLILPAQAQKHVTHNDALRILDAAIQIAVRDRTLTTPPALPDDSDRHIVAIGASGHWSEVCGNPGISTFRWPHLPIPRDILKTSTLPMANQDLSLSSGQLKQLGHQFSILTGFASRTMSNYADPICIFTHTAGESFRSAQ